MAQYYTIVEEKGKRKENVTVTQILGSAWDSELGGRDFTAALVDHFVEELRSKIPDIDEKPRIRAKLRAQLRKARETLSANKEAFVTIPNLDGDFDFESMHLAGYDDCVAFIVLCSLCCVHCVKFIALRSLCCVLCVAFIMLRSYVAFIVLSSLVSLCRILLRIPRINDLSGYHPRTFREIIPTFVGTHHPGLRNSVKEYQQDQG